jgi:transcriptional regulator with XRE-family HTH domain
MEVLKIVYICVMEIKDRIQVIIDSHKLNAGEFAQKIGVQRSSVSHVLSGRNKPGFDFIEKIILSFPRVDAAWLITGKHIQKQAEGVEQETTQKQLSQHVTPSKQHAEIQKIALFYTDGTFEVFKP